MESQRTKKHKDDERNHLLDDLELHQTKGTAIADKADAIGRHLEAILEESDTPRESNNGNHGPFLKPRQLTQLQVTIPRQGHKDIGAKQK